MIFRFAPIARNIFNGHFQRMRSGRTAPIKFIDVGKPFIVGKTKPPSVQFGAEATQCAQVVLSLIHI